MDINTQHPSERNIPAPEPSARYGADSPPPEAESHSSSARSWGKTAAIVVIAMLAGIGLAWSAPRWGKPLWQKFAARPSATSTGHQAVFLTNGQVYFGKVVSKPGADPVVVRDVYYLQVTQQLQPAPEPGASPQSVPQISLVKLGNELHGPTDEMHITRSQILFIEKLKEDSAVVQAIKEFKKQ